MQGGEVRRRSVRIRVLVRLDDAYGRAVARGVVRYAKTRPDWSLHGYGQMSRPDPAGGAADPEADGIIVRAESRAEAERLAALPVPVVDVACAFPCPGLMGAWNDDIATGRRAGEFLTSLGFASFAFCGVQGTVWSSRRLGGFAGALGREESGIERFERPLGWWRSGAPPIAGWVSPGAGAESGQELERWIAALRPGTAIFACNDMAGLRAVAAARAAGLGIPDDISVLGVDDEDLLCELADPSLSSLRLDCERIGRTAAELLAATLDGKRESAGRGVASCRDAAGPKFLEAAGARPVAVVIPPLDVVERSSTPSLVHSDPLAVRAAAWLRANAHRRIDIGDLVAALPASRRTLEVRFRAAVGKTLGETLEEYRLERARRLLGTGDLGMEAIAAACGFGDVRRLYRVFRSTEGCTPGAWRRTARRHGLR